MREMIGLVERGLMGFQQMQGDKKVKAENIATFELTGRPSQRICRWQEENRSGTAGTMGYD
jgi:hypothetical protein